MKKTIFKLISIFLSLCTCLSVVGCTPAGGNTENTIYVYNYNGGYGTEWLNKAKIAYEAINPDITIKVNPQKPLSPLTASDIKAGRDELWFSDCIQYYNVFAEGAIDDISEALTTPNPYDDGKTVESKLSEHQKSFLKINGKYYAVPHYSGYMGFFYNVETFDKYGFYFAKNKPVESFEDNPAGYFTNNKNNLSKGPDGLAGTYDDGLPATYEEFFYLLEYMAARQFTFDFNKTPITHTGGNNEQYIGETMYSLATDYEGLQQMLLNFTFDGQATSLGTVKNGEFVKDAQPTTINNTNGNELARQEGKYYALEFLNKMYSDERYYDKTKAASNTFTCKNAATKLIRGDAGILMEGVWWEEESKPIFQQLGKTKYDYKLAVLPFPKATEDRVGEKTTLYDHLFSTCFMKKGLSEEKKEKIYDFIKFLYSDEQLVEFTATTGTLKAVDYEVPTSAIANLTHYERTLFDYYSKADIVYPYSNNQLFYNNSTIFRSYYYLSANVGGKKYENPVTYFVDRRIDKTITDQSAVTYFNGMYDYYTDLWANNFN